MSLRFKGGERLQRGRGIGGLLRLAKSLFSPIVRSVGKTAVKAATSKIGKKAIKKSQGTSCKYRYKYDGRCSKRKGHERKCKKGT